MDRDTDERLTKAEALDFMTRLFTLIDSKGSSADCKIDANEVLELFDQPRNPLEVPWDYRLALKMFLDQVRCLLYSPRILMNFNLPTLTQELTLASHLVKNLVKRADKNKDNKVTIEEILAFDDFEFLETVYPAVSELGDPGNSFWYLVC